MALAGGESVRSDFGEHASGGIEFVTVLAAKVELRPHRDQRVVVHVMQLAEHGDRIGVALRVKLVRSPRIASSRPVLPVLNDAIDGNLQVAQLRGHAQQLLLRGIALLGLPETELPPGHQGSLAGQMPVSCHRRGNRPVAVAEVVIDRLAIFGGPVKNPRTGTRIAGGIG